MKIKVNSNVCFSPSPPPAFVATLLRRTIANIRSSTDGSSIGILVVRRTKTVRESRLVHDLHSAQLTNVNMQIFMWQSAHAPSAS